MNTHKGTTVTPQGPKEERVAARVSMTEQMISIQEKKEENEETKDNQSIFSESKQCKVLVGDWYS